MEKAVITMLGIQGSSSDVKNNQFKKATYYFEDTKDTKYEFENTFPLLIKRYKQDGYKIVPIYTKGAKEFNEAVLKNTDFDFKFDDETLLIQDDKDYLKIFAQINSIIDMYDEVIIDLTHGFRHIPILTILNILIQNIKSNQKIKAILYAKEINRDKKEYEIVDLSFYLDIANVSYLLSSFESNYTLSKHVKTKNKDFNELIKKLSDFSEHIMSNSLISLFQGQNSLIEKLIEDIEKFIEDDRYASLKHYLLSIKKHLEKILELKDKQTHEQLFELSRIMKLKGYLLNSITLLNEAVGWYCAYSLSQYNNEIKKVFNEVKNSYELIKDSKKAIKFFSEQTSFKNKPEFTFRSMNESESYIKGNDKCAKFAKELIIEIDKLRNNLAHANSGDKLETIENKLQSLIQKFENFCIKEDVLKKKELTLESLQNKFNRR